MGCDAINPQLAASITSVQPVGLADGVQLPPRVPHLRTRRPLSQRAHATAPFTASGVVHLRPSARPGQLGQELRKRRDKTGHALLDEYREGASLRVNARWRDLNS